MISSKELICYNHVLYDVIQTELQEGKNHKFEFEAGYKSKYYLVMSVLCTLVDEDGCCARGGELRCCNMTQKKQSRTQNNTRFGLREGRRGSIFRSR